MHRQWQELETRAIHEGWSHSQFLLALCEIEQQQRYASRVQRFLRESGLQGAKSLSNFDFTCCPTVKKGLILQLAQDSSWLSRGENLLIFGPSGVGKTHLASAIGRSLAETSVLFELIAHRYEIKSLLITANHTFSEWDTIFTDATMTVAAIDRLVHHATIIEIRQESFRQKTALARSHSE
jgi:DNA replication protein DnaC